uniref:Uncharacterized protein n=1 Tax=Compsopogon caeruleus TaxID=31354 RepID=A0A6T6ACR6_9RHOD|mmetsp:Transcript_10266/g.20702  ORF Transcript_10266/g.20702 Transcript_10266/m.20702 type:complete len:152 (+) Transcript_10266:62-517(+)
MENQSKLPPSRPGSRSATPGSLVGRKGFRFKFKTVRHVKGPNPKSCVQLFDRPAAFGILILSVSSIKRERTVIQLKKRIRHLEDANERLLHHLFGCYTLLTSIPKERFNEHLRRNPRLGQDSVHATLSWCRKKMLQMTNRHLPKVSDKDVL